MDSHIEKAEYLTFGKTKIDVSNIPYNRIIKASRIWNEIREFSLNIRPKTEDETKTQYDTYVLKEKVKRAKQFDKKIDSIGLYLIRQPLNILSCRFTLLDSIKSFIQRYSMTVRKVKRSNKTQYEAFQEWIYFTLTGEKKKHLEAKETVIDQVANMYEEMENLYGISPDVCKGLLQTLLADQAKLSNLCIKDHKA